MKCLSRRVAALLACLLAGMLQAEPIVPSHDSDVIEILPSAPGNRSEQRRLRQRLTQRPDDAALAVELARRHLEQAHRLGDPRFAGLAMAMLRPWSDNATMPADVLLMKATLQQYLHEFDASVASLQALLSRPDVPGRAQALLTLATVHRVQGRYAESDAACRQVVGSGAAPYGTACLAENAALRGDVDAARRDLVRLLGHDDATTDIRAWLTTTLAELEQRAGRGRQAEAAYRAALALQPDPYTTLAFCDFLLEQGRPAEVLALLATQVRTDAVVLRLAIAGVQANAASAAADAGDMRERIALANQRPDAKLFHGREQAMFALHVERQPAAALALARGNVAHQREPLDVLVLAQAARAAGEPAALQEVQRVMREMGLQDRRIEALL